MLEGALGGVLVERALTLHERVEPPLAQAAAGAARSTRGPPLYVRMADLGEIDAKTKKSVGLRIELTSEADLEVVSSAESNAAGGARQEILLEAHGPKSRNKLLTLARDRAEVLREAVC